MKAIIFDAFGTLFKVTSGGSAKAIIKTSLIAELPLMKRHFSRYGKPITKNTRQAIAPL